MKFSELVSNATAWLKREGRVSYRALRLEFSLGDDMLEALTEELIDIKECAVDKDGKMLVWSGESRAVVEVRDRGASAATVGAPRIEFEALDTTAERRQLSVMFCDLVGSTLLSEQLDPEDLREVMRTYQETAATIIDVHGGHIAQYLGDGLLVYFGYPRAHEDDARRAVHAGLEIINAVKAISIPGRSDEGRYLAVRVGIHTGLVVVGEVGAGNRREQLALGQTPNLAARIQGWAEPNTLVISSATAQLVAGRVNFEALGTKQFDGITEPIAVSRVLGVLDDSTSDQRAGSGGGVPFLMGRHEELGLLLRRWEQSKKGLGQTILIKGEAGIGKTALAQAISAYVVREGFTRLTFYCSPYHQNSPLHPLIAHLHRTFGFEPDESASIKLERLESVLDRFHPFKLEEVVPLFASLFSLDLGDDRYAPLEMGPEQQRQRTHDALNAWMVEEAKRRPALVIWEDVHLADPSTLELLELTFDEMPTIPALNVVTFRSDFVPPWNLRAHMTQVALDRLDRSDVEAMITGLSGGLTLPAQVVDEIVDKADGVPLFVEELTKTVLVSDFLRPGDDRYELASQNLPSLAIPATLQDLLMARLDRWPEVREIAQLGAVLGREFSYEMLASLSPVDESTLQQRLAQLVDAELLNQQGRPPRAKYFFRQALIQDAAYESLLRSVRQHYHVQIAQLLEASFPDSVEVQPERLAHHFTEAGRVEQAIPYWLRAGQRAVERWANTEAIAHFTKGLKVLEALPDMQARLPHELELQMALGLPLMNAKGWGAPDVERVFNRARELCQQLGETAKLFGILAGLCVFHVAGRSEMGIAHKLAERLLQLAEQEDDTALLLQAHMANALTFFYTGDVAAARVHTQRSIHLYDAPQHHTLIAVAGLDIGVAAYVIDALSLWLLGYPEQARARNREALDLMEALDHPFSSAWASVLAAMLYKLLGEKQAVQDHVEIALKGSQERGLTLFLSWAKILQSAHLAEQGHHAQAVTQAREGLNIFPASGTEVWEPFYLAELAEIHGRAGELVEGLEMIAAALEINDRRGERWYEAEICRLGGELHAQSSDQQEAAASFQKALEIAAAQNAKSLELRAATSLAQLWQQQGKHGDARRLLAGVYEWFTEGLDMRDLRAAKSLLDSLERAGSTAK